MLPQLMSLLTPTQQEQFQAGLQAGKGVRQSVLATNLSMPQRLQVMQLLQSLQGQLSQILTPEQQQQARKNLQTLQQQGR
jgi:Spy/CpxP family protein refolding chaperone